ncbi:hypothetical protein [Brevundimonas sp.]|uniref:hypothetical protein n=1 Tax=Brevundimonas sp. TaxID=1871086 RepID=UPI00289A2E44|nr:hypothetical protein [Brevundimonas sp.]
MTDATNNTPNAGQSEDPKNKDSLQQQAREETSKAEGERQPSPSDDNAAPDDLDRTTSEAPPIANPD